MLQRPASGWMGSDIHVRQAACAVLDDDKDVQHPERGRDGHEEVTRENGRGVISQERRPALVSSRLTRRALRHVLAHRSR